MHGDSRVSADPGASATLARRALAVLVGVVVAASVAGCVFPGEFGESLDESSVGTDLTGDAEACVAGEVRCDGTCIDPQTSGSHCGECDSRCEGGQVCAEGACECPTDTADCERDGVCIALTTSENCGVCGVACGIDEICLDGDCQCLLCGGDTCIDIFTDPAHCGGCGQACAPRFLCAAGECVVSGLPDSNDVACRDADLNEVTCGTSDLPGQDGNVSSTPVRVEPVEDAEGQAYFLPALELQVTLGQVVTDWQGAQERCIADRSGGFDDWRLPTRHELIALMDAHRDESRWYPGPGTGDVPAAPVWTSDVANDNVWTVHFTDPRARVEPIDPTEEGSALCVRGRPPVRPWFEHSGASSHLERASGLRYLRLPGLDVSWVGALAHCASVPQRADCGPWHLASVKELALIVGDDAPGLADWAAGTSPTDEGLGNATRYWSSTPVFAGTVDEAYALINGRNQLTTQAMGELGAAVCVCDPGLE